MREGLERGDFDFIAAGRALLADAALGNRLRDARPDTITRFEPKHLTTLD